MQQVVVTGLGAITPAGNTAADTWASLLAGRPAVGPITQFDASDQPVRIAGEVTGFDPEDLLDHKRLRRSARFSQLAVAASREAAGDAGLVVDEDNAGRVGVVMNTAVAGVGETAANTHALRDRGVRGVSPYFVSSVIPNMPACEVAIDLGINGPVTASSLACASGVYALLEARQLILAGDADVVIAGGTDSSIAPVWFGGLSNMGALSRRNDDPGAASRPFDRDRDGFVYGEGAVALVVESAEHARARGATIYAEVAGGSLTCDAFHVTKPDPSAVCAATALEQALARADLSPADIDYICAHGTSTRINDVTETRAIRQVFGKHADGLPISSPKSMVGHLIGAAGALSALVCVLAIRDGIVPPTINLDTPDPECDLDYVPHVARRVPVRATTANGFGFGGQNAVVVLREF